MELWSWLHLRLLFQIIGLLNHSGGRWLSDPTHAEGLDALWGQGRVLRAVSYWFWNTPRDGNSTPSSSPLPQCLPSSLWKFKIFYASTFSNQQHLSDSGSWSFVNQTWFIFTIFIISHTVSWTSQAVSLRPTLWNSFKFRFLFFLALSSHWKSLSLTFCFSFNLRGFL